MACVWWPTAVLALGGGPLPNPAWPIFGFLGSSGRSVQSVPPKTRFYIFIDLI